MESSIPDGKSDLRAAKPSELIARIVNTHHAYLRKELSLLSRSSEDSGHYAGRPFAGRTCIMYNRTFRKLEELESDIREHIHLESNLLFPQFREHCE